MENFARGRDPSRDEPKCYNCGLTGHQTIACPEPTREVPAGLEAFRKRQASAKNHGSNNNHGYNKHGPGKSNSSQSRHNGMVVTRYPPPPGTGGPPIAHYPPQQHHLPQPPPPPSLPLPPPPPPVANGPPQYHHNNSHGYEPPRHPLPPHPPPYHQPGPEPWSYPPQQQGYAGPYPGASSPATGAAPYPAYDAYGQPIQPSVPQPPSEGPYGNQSYGQPPPFYTTPPPGVTGPPVAAPPSFGGSPFSSLPPAPHHQPPSGPSHPGPSGPYPQTGYGQPFSGGYPPYVPPPTGPANATMYSQGNSNNAWRHGKRGGGFAGQFHRGGRNSFGRGRGQRNMSTNFRRGPPEKLVMSAIPTGPAAMGNSHANGFSQREREPGAAHTDKPESSTISKPLISPEKSSSIPAKPPTPISMKARPIIATGSGPRNEPTKAEHEPPSTQDSPNKHAGADDQDALAQKRYHDGNLATEEDRGFKRTRPSPAHTSPVGLPNPPSGIPGALVSPYGNNRRFNGDSSRPAHSPSKNGLLNLPNGPPWSNRPPNRILDYGTSDKDSGRTSVRTDSGYQSNDVSGSTPTLPSIENGPPTGLSAPSSLPSRRPPSSQGQSSRSRSPVRRLSDSSRPGSRRSHSPQSKSRSSSPLDDFELAMLGMVRPDDGKGDHDDDDDDDDDGEDDTDRRKASHKSRKRVPPKVAAAYSRRW